MNLNVQKAKLYVEERLAVVPLVWDEIKTRYGATIESPVETDTGDGSGMRPHLYKISFNTKSVTVGEMVDGKWASRVEMTEKQLADMAHVCRVLDFYLPRIDESKIQRAYRRYQEAVSRLEGHKGADVAVTVSAGAVHEHDAPQTPVAAPKPAKKKLSKREMRLLPAVQELVVEDAGTAVVNGQEIPVVEFTAAETVEKVKAITPKERMLQMVLQSGLPFVESETKYGHAYECENVTITFSKTMLKIQAVVELYEHDGKIKPVYGTWLTGDYKITQIEILEEVLALVKEAVRLRAMSCLNIPEVRFSYSENNFIASRGESVHYRNKTIYIYVGYQINGYNCEHSEMKTVVSLRYNRPMLMQEKGAEKLPSEKHLLNSTQINKNAMRWSYKFYSPSNPVKLMFIECEEITYTTNKELLAEFGVKVAAEVREKEWHMVRVPLAKVPTKS